MKRILAAGAILAVCCTVGWAPAALAADKGPAEIILQSTIDPAKTPAGSSSATAGSAPAPTRARR